MPTAPRVGRRKADAMLNAVAGEGNVVAVEQLLMDLTTAECLKQLPLHKAAANGHTAVISLLLRKSLPVDARNRAKRTPLHSAAQAGRGDIAQLLLAAGADCNAVDVVKQSPLHFAAMYDRAPLVQILVGAGAVVNTCNAHGSTPLHKAAEAGRCACGQSCVRPRTIHFKALLTVLTFGFVA
eukprot:SAG11_NODE_146_length_14788_cov_5.672884_3_plen_182_part_00